MLQILTQSLKNCVEWSGIHSCFYHAAESLHLLFVCLQSQYRFVCEAILKVYEEEIVKPCETEPPVEKEEWTPLFSVSELLLWFTTTACEICAQLAVAPCWKAVDMTACKLEYRRKSTIALYSDKQWLEGIFHFYERKKNHAVSGYWFIGTVNNVNYLGRRKKWAFAFVPKAEMNHSPCQN